MKKLIKVFMIFLVCCSFIGLWCRCAIAKENGVKIKLMNQQISTNTSQAVVEIKNRKASKIFISKVSIQRKNENWVEWKKQKIRCRIDTKTKEYVDINVRGIPYGSYRMVFRVKKNGKVKKVIIRFTVVDYENDSNQSDTKKESESTGFIQDKPIENETTTKEPDVNQHPQPAPGLPPSMKPDNPAMNKPPACTVSKNQMAKSKSGRTKSIKQILLNKDFRISKQGKAEAVVFSESDYKTAYRTKIYLKIQRKTKKGIKNYIKYKQVKKSNIAYMNREFWIKKKGRYRMYVKIISYTKKGRKSVRCYRSKFVNYEG